MPVFVILLLTVCILNFFEIQCILHQNILNSEYSALNYLCDGIDTYVANTRWAKKARLFLTVDNFAAVSDGMACNMSKVSTFHLEKRIELGCQ